MEGRLQQPFSWDAGYRAARRPPVRMSDTTLSGRVCFLSQLSFSLRGSQGVGSRFHGKFRRLHFWCYPPAGLFDWRHTVKTRLNPVASSQSAKPGYAPWFGPFAGFDLQKRANNVFTLLAEPVPRKTYRFSVAPVERLAPGATTSFTVCHDPFRVN